MKRRYLLVLMISLSQSLPAFSETWIRIYNNEEDKRYIDMKSIVTNRNWRYGNMKFGDSLQNSNLFSIKINCSKGILQYPDSDGPKYYRNKSGLWSYTSKVSGMEFKGKEIAGLEATHNFFCKEWQKGFPPLFWIKDSLRR